MKARKKFPVSVPCKRCKGRGRVEKKRDIIPCKHCGHDIHYEHHTEEGWTSTPGYGWDTYLLCMIDDCKCSTKVPRDYGEKNFNRGDWAHP